jgi:hypothetical protein
LFRYEFSNQTNSHKKSYCVNIEISAYDKSYEKSYEKADSVNFTLANDRAVPLTFKEFQKTLLTVSLLIGQATVSNVSPISLVLKLRL